MVKMNTGYSSFSSGPERTQAIPTLEHTPTIPTQYGIPNMSMDMSMAKDETIVHLRGTGKPAIYAGTSGGKHPEHEANFEKHLSAIGQAAEEQRPMSVREGVLTKAKTHRVENLPKE